MGETMKKANWLIFLLAALLIGGITCLAADSPKSENSGLQQGTTKSAKTIVDNWQFKDGKGFANVMLESDGHYLFSGKFVQDVKDEDFDISLALKSSEGGIIVVRYVGDATHGVEWSKEGYSDIVKQNFNSFSKHNFAGSYYCTINTEGRLKEYIKAEQKTINLLEKEVIAWERKDEKLAKQLQAEREKLAQQQAQQQNNNSGGGSSIGSVLGTIGTVAATVLSFL
jgi:hypothetical protein